MTDVAEIQERACLLAHAQCTDDEVRCALASEFSLSAKVAAGHVDDWRSLLEQERVTGVAMMRESLYMAARHAGTSDGLKAAIWLSTQYLGFSSQGVDGDMRKWTSQFGKMTKQEQVTMLRKALAAIEGESVLGGAH